MKQSVPAGSEQVQARQSPSVADVVHAGESKSFVDNRPEMIAQRQLMDAIRSSPRMIAQRKMVAVFRNSSRMVAQRTEPRYMKSPAPHMHAGTEYELLQGKFGAIQRAGEEKSLQCKFATAQRVEEEEPLQGKFAAESPAQLEQQFVAKPNNTGLPDNLKSGIEHLSGISMDSVRVHYNSSQPAQLNALAYAQATDIHVAPGQEQHLPHETWHVVQQAQRRVQPTIQMKDGAPVNDDKGLEHEADVMGARAKKGDVSGKLSLNYPIQLADKPHISQVSSTVQKVPWDAVAHGNEQGLEAHLNNPLTPGTHNTLIGADQDPNNALQTVAGERHLDQRMLGLIQTVFDNLPTAHIKGNASLARVVLRESMGANGAGMASFYDPNNHSLNLVVPGDVNSWFYLQVDRWPFGDMATTLISEVQNMSDQWNEYQGGNISGMDFFKEALGAPIRFMTHNVTSSGTTGDKIRQGLSTESFVQWIIRHETGHSVDDAIGWYANNHYQDPACGGWDVVNGMNEANMVLEILNAVGINGGALANLNLAFNPHTGAGYTSMLNAVQNRRKQELSPGYRAAAIATFEGTNPGGTRLVDFAENVIRIGLSRPWENGGATNVGGRAYHRDTQHNNWVSYIHAKYAVRNSNYQFQNPGEWFAESYQAYFRGQPVTWGQNLRDPVARAWFTNNLVPPPAGGGVLINGGDLINIAGPAAPVVAPGAGTAAIPTRLENFLSTTAEIGINAVKIPFDVAVGTALLPIKVAKKIPPVNWALKWLGF